MCILYRKVKPTTMMGGVDVGRLVLWFVVCCSVIHGVVALRKGSTEWTGSGGGAQRYIEQIRVSVDVAMPRS